MRIILIGPPGAGKGTQAGVIASDHRIPTVSTGDLLRAELAAGSALGERARPLIEMGELVPDVIVDQVVEDWIRRERKGFVLDGYPRTVNQADHLDRTLAAWGSQIDVVISFAVNPALLSTRLRRRASESGRVDDSPDVFETRMRAFHYQTGPVLDYFDTRGKLVTINAGLPVDAVTAQIREIIGLPFD